MSSHPRMRRDSTLQVHLAALLQGAQVRATKGLRGDADNERVFVKGRDGQTCAIDGYGVAKVAVAENL